MKSKKLLSKSIKDLSGELVIIQDELENFKFKRLFFVHADIDCKRGCHAHIECQQFLICVKGEVKVFFDDGLKKSSTTLKKGYDGIMIPKGVWSEQLYKEGSILLVLCMPVHQLHRPTYR